MPKACSYHLINNITLYKHHTSKEQFGFGSINYSKLPKVFSSFFFPLIIHKETKCYLD